MSGNMEVKLNKSDQNIGMQFDQDQLSQITQLINNLQQQQQQPQFNTNSPQTNNNANSQIFNNDNLANFEFQNQQTIQFQNQIDTTNNNISFNNQTQYYNPSNQGSFKMDQAENYQFQVQQAPVQMSTDQSQEYHTIMVNGQPALFIPASSAMSNNLLCQMMMSNGQMNPDQVNTINQNENLTANYNNNNTGVYTDPNMINFENNTNQMANWNGNNQNEANQQIICIQQDGNITFQTMPFQTPDTPQQQQQQLEQANESESKLDENKELAKKSELSSVKSGQKKKTVASAFANTSNIAKKKKVDKIPKKIVKKPDTLEFNSNANLKLSPNENSSASYQDMKTENDNDDKMSEENNSNTGPASDIIDVSHGAKQKRKACECRNCIHWKTNYSKFTPAELAKKRTHCCHKCPKEYNKTSHLRAHLRAHDNYRPYICDFISCGKCFTRSDELKRHKRIHNDDRNFVCSICSKKFLRSDHLNKHILVHNKPTGAYTSALLAVSDTMTAAPDSKLPDNKLPIDE